MFVNSDCFCYRINSCMQEKNGSKSNHTGAFVNYTYKGG